MKYEDIKLDIKDKIATIAIDRPKVLNAIRYETMLEIQSALESFENDPDVRVIVITGAGDKALFREVISLSWEPPRDILKC